MTEYLQNCFSGPALPASVLLLLLAAYWILVILGALELELFDFDLDLDTDVDADADVPSNMHHFLGMGMVVLKFLNLGNVPLMIWLSTFSLSFWLIAMLWDDPSYREGLWITAQIILRNAALAIVATKILTQPLARMFAHVEPTSHKDLVGQLCIITTSDVTKKFGQARLETEGAPLLLNVRAQHGKLMKGDCAEIVEFDPVNNVYFVDKANREV